jgi:hypothetical protein
MTCTTNIKGSWLIVKFGNREEIVDVCVDSAGMINPIEPSACLLFTGLESDAISVSSYLDF